MRINYDVPPVSAATIFLENNKIGDGCFIPEIAATLREYADMLDAKTAGHHTAEQWTSKGGTRLFILASAWYGDEIPRPADSLDFRK